MAEQAGGVLHILRIQTDIISQLSVYQIEYSMGDGPAENPRIREVAGDDSMAEFLSRELGRDADEVAQTMEKLRNGERARIEGVNLDDATMRRLHFGAPRRAA